MRSPSFKNLFSFTKAEIRHTFNNVKSSEKVLGLKILRAPRTLDFGRMLVITSKKVGNAPKRNLIRRRLKSIFYEEKLGKQPFDIIVIASKDTVQAPFSKLKEALINATANKK